MLGAQSQTGRATAGLTVGLGVRPHLPRSFTWRFPPFATQKPKFFHYFFMASGKYIFCQKHLLNLKFKNMFYLVNRLQPTQSPYQGLSPLGASSGGRDECPRPEGNPRQGQSSDPRQYSSTSATLCQLWVVGDKSLHRGRSPTEPGSAGAVAALA